MLYPPQFYSVFGTEVPVPCYLWTQLQADLNYLMPSQQEPPAEGMESAVLSSFPPSAHRLLWDRLLGFPTGIQRWFLNASFFFWGEGKVTGIFECRLCIKSVPSVLPHSVLTVTIEVGVFLQFYR